MCFTYSWRYKCGCIAPRPTNDPLVPCTSVSTTCASKNKAKRNSCNIAEITTYLESNCTTSCSGGSSIDNEDMLAYQAEERDNYLYYGKRKGEDDWVPWMDWYDDVPQYMSHVAILPFPNVVLPSFGGRISGWGVRRSGGLKNSSARGEIVGGGKGVDGRESVESEGETASVGYNSRLERRKR